MQDRGFPEEVLDEILPDDFEWEEMVVRYPTASLAVATAVGYFVGRRHGTEIITALSTFLSSRVEGAVDQFLGER